MQLGVDFGGSMLKVGLADAGQLIDSVRLPVDGTAADLDRVADAARSLAGEGDIDGVGVAVPGLVDAAGRRLVEAHGKYAWLLGADVLGWAERTFGATARLENDARAALIGETSAGAAIGEGNAVILVLGTGIGTAALLDGTPVRGPHGSAAILGGHVTIDRNGPACNCGNIGCAEVFGATWALPARLEHHRAAGVTGEVDGTEGFAGVVAGARRGDSLATTVLDEAVRAWAICALNLCHDFDPEVVIVAGGVARSADLIAPALQDHLDAHLWGSLPRPRVVVSAEPDLSVLRGLAVLAAEVAA
jgi:glucokinase